MEGAVSMGKVIVEAEVSLDGVVGGENMDFWSQLFQFHTPDVQEYLDNLLFMPDALVMGRETYQGFAEVWPTREGKLADRINSMPKYVASRTLSGPLEWNATLLAGNLADSVSSLKDKHHGNLVVSGAGELARELMAHGLVDEVWFTVSPYLWASGPRIFEDVGDVRLELVSTTTFPSGVVRLCYRPAPAGTSSTG